MFEFSIAKKYLTPKWKQLSVSIISLISILVISLVVWLIVVFFSVSNGLEKGWIEKLTALTAPIRITPTEDYYNSYYYEIDSISEASDYAKKSLKEKLTSLETDPYDPSNDEEIPHNFSLPLLNSDGSLKDLVKEAFFEIQSLENDRDIHEKLIVDDYEVTMSQLKVHLIRQQNSIQSESVINQSSYLGTYNDKTENFDKILSPLNIKDINHFISKGLKDPSIDLNTYIDFIQPLEILQLIPKEKTWKIQTQSINQPIEFQGILITYPNLKKELVIPTDETLLKDLMAEHHKLGFKTEIGTIKILNNEIFFNGSAVENPNVKTYGTIVFDVDKRLNPFQSLNNKDEIRFLTNTSIQGKKIETTLFLKNALVHQLKFYPKELKLNQKEGILLPKSFREAGVLAFDQATISYYTPTMSALQEQQTETYVKGFYDPGIIPIGGKFILGSQSLVNAIKSAQSSDEMLYTNGINVHFQNLEKAELLKNKIEENFEKKGLKPFFKVETFRNFDFAKDILEQLQSDKTLFTLISTIIIIVACSNIISMLIIMVNDKKVEIGILRSMGTTSFSIALIFGTCGIFMGLIGSLIGLAVAFITLKNMDLLIYFLNEIQGHNAFNPMFYGETLPNEMSYEAVFFVIFATSLISLLAGIIPALKASGLKPSHILRSE